MTEYVCPKFPESHVGVELITLGSSSPHKFKIVCAKCDRFIKWGNDKDAVRINSEQAQAMLDEETDNAILCPLMSGMVIQSAKSEVRPARLRFEGNACVGDRCAWWASIDDACAVKSIAFALLELKVGSST